MIMHNRVEASYADLIGEIVADLRAALKRAVALGVDPGDLIVDPGFGFGKTAEHNLTVLRELGTLRVLGRPTAADMMWHLEAFWAKYPDLVGRDVISDEDLLYDDQGLPK